MMGIRPFPRKTTEIQEDPVQTYNVLDLARHRQLNTDICLQPQSKQMGLNDEHFGGQDGES